MYEKLDYLTCVKMLDIDKKKAYIINEKRKNSMFGVGKCIQCKWNWIALTKEKRQFTICIM